MKRSAIRAPHTLRVEAIIREFYQLHYSPNHGNISAADLIQICSSHPDPPQVDLHRLHVAVYSTLSRMVYAGELDEYIGRDRHRKQRHCFKPKVAGSASSRVDSKSTPMV